MAEVGKEYNWEGKTILIVEDEQSNFFLAHTFLTRGLANLVRARTGLEAVNYCNKNTLVDLVLMDIKMPEMNGYEATGLIKKDRPDLPIIAITAFALMGDKEKATYAGCDDYLAKPYVMNQLMEVVDKYI